MCARSRRGPVGGFALSEADDAWLPRWRNAVGRRGPTRRASSASPARSTSPTATAAARSSRRSRPSTKRCPRNICPRALLGSLCTYGARASFLFAQLPFSRSLRPRAGVASLQAFVWRARVGDLTSHDGPHHGTSVQGVLSTMGGCLGCFGRSRYGPVPSGRGNSASRWPLQLRLGDRRQTYMSS